MLVRKFPSGLRYGIRCDLWVSYSIGCNVFVGACYKLVNQLRRFHMQDKDVARALKSSGVIIISAPEVFTAYSWKEYVRQFGHLFLIPHPIWLISVGDYKRLEEEYVCRG